MRRGSCASLRWTCRGFGRSWVRLDSPRRRRKNAVVLASTEQKSRACSYVSLHLQSRRHANNRAQAARAKRCAMRAQQGGEQSQHPFHRQHSPRPSLVARPLRLHKVLLHVVVVLGLDGPVVLDAAAVLRPLGRVVLGLGVNVRRRLGLLPPPYVRLRGVRVMDHDRELTRCCQRQSDTANNTDGECRIRVAHLISAGAVSGRPTQR